MAVRIFRKHEVVDVLDDHARVERIAQSSSGIAVKAVGLWGQRDRRVRKGAAGKGMNKARGNGSRSRK